MKKINIYNIFLAIFILLLSTIIIFPNWGIIDDHQIISNCTFKQVIEQNKGVINLGRFPCIYTIEHYILSNIWLNPFLFYFINIIYVCISLLFLSRLLIEAFSSKSKYFLSFIILSPAFVECFYRLAPNEKQLFVLISIFLFTFYRFIKFHKKKYLTFALIISFISLYYKEPAFILYSGLGFIWYFENRYLLKKDNMELYKEQKSQQIFIFFIISAVIFIVFYKLITINATTQYNNFFVEQSYLQRVIQSIKIIKNYFFSNPIVMVGIPLSVLIRLIYWDKINTHFRSLNNLRFLPFYDGLLFGSLLFTSAIIFLGIGAHRYLLPALGFSFIPVLFYISYVFKYRFNKAIKAILLTMFVILLLNSAIIGINNAIQLKVEPYQFQKMLKVFVPELRKDISSLNENEKIDIYLPGYDRGANVETFTSLGDFLKYNGVKENKFDFKFMEPVSNYVIYNYYKNYYPQYSIYQSENIFYPKEEDYLLLYNEDRLPINYSDYLAKNSLSTKKIFPEEIFSILKINAPLDVVFKIIIDKFGYQLKHKEDVQFTVRKPYSWCIYKIENKKFGNIKQ